MARLLTYAGQVIDPTAYRCIYMHVCVYFDLYIRPLHTCSLFMYLHLSVCVYIYIYFSLSLSLSLSSCSPLFPVFGVNENHCSPQFHPVMVEELVMEIIKGVWLNKKNLFLPATSQKQCPNDADPRGQPPKRVKLPQCPGIGGINPPKNLVFRKKGGKPSKKKRNLKKKGGEP